MVFARKINIIPEFYMIIARKITFPPNFGSTPVSYAFCVESIISVPSFDTSSERR